MTKQPIVVVIGSLRVKSTKSIHYNLPLSQSDIILLKGSKTSNLHQQQMTNEYFLYFSQKTNFREKTRYFKLSAEFLPSMLSIEFLTLCSRHHLLVD